MLVPLIPLLARGIAGISFASRLFEIILLQELRYFYGLQAFSLSTWHPIYCNPCLVSNADLAERPIYFSSLTQFSVILIIVSRDEATEPLRLH